MERTYYVYILANRSRTLYTGVTSKVLERVKQHREGLFPGFACQYRIHRLVYLETYRHVKAAIAREKQIKGLSRAKKIALIEARNPTSEDLAAEWFASYPRKADSPRKKALGEEAVLAALGMTIVLWSGPEEPR